MLLAFLSLTCGLILDTVTRGRQEAKRIAYLAIPGPDFQAGAPPDHARGTKNDIGDRVQPCNSRAIGEARR
jgi:hypothetical protein